MSIKPITNTLALLQGGLFIDRCSELMADVVKSVEDTGKAGKLTITIEVKKAGGAVELAAKVTNKAPERKPDSDLFWPTVEGNLSLQNPNQRNLDLRDATPQRTEIRSVDPSTGEIKTAAAL